MKILYAFATATLIAANAFGQQGNFEWAQDQNPFEITKSSNSRDTYFEQKWAQSGGTAGSSYNQFNAVATDLSGNVYVVGTIEGNATFGTQSVTSPAGVTKMIIGKLSSTGSWLWLKVATGGASEGNDIAIKGSEIYVTGTFETSMTFGNKTANGGSLNEAFVLKIDQSGNGVWAKRIGGQGNQQGHQIEIGSDGSVYVSGDYTTQITIGSSVYTSRGERDFFVTKMSSSGNFTWSADFGSSGIDRLWEMAISSSDELMLTGSFRTNLELPNNIVLNSLSTARDDAFAVFVNSSGTFTRYGSFGGGANVEGSAAAFNSQGVAFFTINFDETLYLGSTTIGSPGGDWGYAVLALTTGNQLYLQFYSTADVFLKDMKFDADDYIHMTGADISYNLVLDAEIYLWKINYIDQTTFTFDSDYFGSPEGWDQPYGMHLDGNGGIYIAGEHEYTLYFGGQQYNSNAPQMAVLAKIQDLGDTTITSVNEIEKQHVHLWPNPSNGSEKLSFDNVFETHEIVVYNPMGDVIFESRTNNSSIDLNNETWPSGVYNIIVETSGEKETLRMLKL